MADKLANYSLQSVQIYSANKDDISFAGNYIAQNCNIFYLNVTGNS